MKTLMFMVTVLAVIGFASFQALSAELSVDKNGAKFGDSSRINILPTGTVSLTDKTLFSSLTLHMATNDYGLIARLSRKQSGLNLA